MQKNMTPFKKGLLALAITASLAGCSGGGGGSSSSSSSDDVTMSGTAAKGVIAGGIVIAEQLTANGVVELGRATTNADGDYSINFPDSYNANNGVVRVRVVPNEEGTTTMTCDAPAGCDGVAFGDPITLAANSGFEMAAVTTPGTNEGRVSVQITPFSHMAASAAGALDEAPTVTPADVATANLTITSLVGFDILNTKTSDLAHLDGESDNGATKFALLNAAIATNMFDGTSASASDALTEGLEELAAALEDGSLDADQAGTDAFSIDELQASVERALADAQNELSAEDLEINLDEIQGAGNSFNDYQEQVVEVVFPDGLEPVEVTEVENQSDVEAAKALIGDVRTLLSEIEATNFETPLDALGTDTETAKRVFSTESAKIMQMVGDAIESALTTLDSDDTEGVPGPNDTVTFTTPVTDTEGNALGNLTLVTRFTDTGLSIVISGNLTDGEKTVTITNLTLAVDGATAFNLEDDNVTDYITTDGVTVALSGAITDGSTSISLNEMSLVSTLMEETKITEGQEANLASVINTMSLNGDITLQANGAQFDGAAVIELVRLNENAQRTLGSAELPLSLDLVRLSGEFTKADKRFSASVELDVEGAAGFDSFAFAQFDAHPHFGFEADDLTAEQITELETLINAQITAPEGLTIQSLSRYYFFSYDDYLNGVEEGTLQWQVTFSDSSYEVIEPSQALLDGLDDMAETLIISEYGSEISDQGFSFDSFEFNVDGWILFSGDAELEDFESVDNFLQGELTIQSELALPNLPEMRLVTRLDRDSLNGGTVTITPYWGTETYTMTISSNNVNADTVAVDVSIENPITGVEISMSLDDIDAEDLEGTITVNGKSVATISGDNIPLVRYNDGTFESLF